MLNEREQLMPILQQNEILFGHDGTPGSIACEIGVSSQWDSDNPDENIEHSKAKLSELYDKFRPFIAEDKASTQKTEFRSQ